MVRTFRPVGDKVLVKPDAAEEVTEGGIVLPDQVRQAPGRGKVLAVGSGVSEAKEGDIVLYNKYDVTGVEIDGEDYVVIYEDKLLLRIVEENDGCGV